MSLVFISYRHSDTHSPRVAELAQTLRDAGVNVVIDSDKLPAGPDEGWPKWSQQQVEKADKVLIACTQGWRECYEANGPLEIGHGCAAEAHIVRQMLYNQAFNNKKFRIVLLSPENSESIPVGLQPYHVFQWHSSTGKKNLLIWLSAIAKEENYPPPLASISWPKLNKPFNRTLANRNAEFQVIKSMLTGYSYRRALLIHGSSNRGKTTLITECRRLAIHLQLDHIWIDCKNSIDLMSIVEQFEIESHVISPEKSLVPLRKHLKNILEQRRLPYVLLIDTFEEAPLPVQNWIENDILAYLDAYPALRVIVCGQMLPKYFGSAGRVLKFELHPIKNYLAWEHFCSRQTGHTPLPSGTTSFIKHLILALNGEPGNVASILLQFTKRLNASKRN